MIFISSMAFKIFSHYDKRKEFLNMFLLQIVWSEKNQSAELKRNKIKQDQDKEDQLDKEFITCPKYFPKSLYFLKENKLAD